MRLYCIDRKIALILCFLTSASIHAVCQGNQNPLSQEEFQLKFKNDTLITDKHIQVAGTKLFIVPPDSFVVALSFNGFIEKSTGANIIIHKGQSSYLSTVEMYSSPQTLKYANWKSEKMKIKGKDSFFICSENSPSSMDSMVEWVLVCESEGGCYLLQGRYPSASQDYSTRIKKSILSTIIQ